MMSITEIADLFLLTRQAVYIPLRKGKFPAKKHCGTRWKINFEDYKKYHQNRYSRKIAKKEDGSLVFDKDKGIYSVNEAADYLNRDVQWVYYRLRTGRIPAKRYRASWLIHIDELKKMQERKIKSA